MTSEKGVRPWANDKFNSCAGAYFWDDINCCLVPAHEYYQPTEVTDDGTLQSEEDSTGELEEFDSTNPSTTGYGKSEALDGSDAILVRSLDITPIESDLFRVT